MSDGDTYELGTQRAEVLFTPGHTRGHVVYFFPDAEGGNGGGALFAGGTLFALGCGRLFEGTPAQMWASLQKLERLPDAAKVYCAHEYTQANGRFALSVEPGNEALRARMATVDAARERGEATVPSTMEAERATNPFLRPSSADLQATVGMAGAALGDVFAETRRRKDNF